MSSVIKDINQPRSASDVYEWRSTGGAATGNPSDATTANVTVLAIQTEDVAQTFPSLVGVAAYVAIQASPQQNGTALYLSAGTGAGASSVACPAGAKEWRLCIVTLDSVPEGALSVSLTASVGAVWRLSDLVLAPIGAPLSSM